MFVDGTLKRVVCGPARFSARLFWLAMGGLAVLAAPAIAAGPYYAAYPPANPYLGPGYAIMAPYTGPVPPYGAGSLMYETESLASPAVAGTAPSRAVSPDAPAGSPCACFGCGSTSAVPTMIGDFIGYGGFFGWQPGVAGGNTPIAGGDRRFKIAENQSPIPADRVYFAYNNFHNALRAIDGPGAFHQVNFERYTLGVEKAFLGHLFSMELRVPIGHGLDSDLHGSPGASLEGAEFGNLVVVAKTCLLRRRGWVASAGIGVSIPTADDARQFDSAGLLRSEIDNESFHLQPFIGWVWTPTERFFAEAFSAVDIDPHGYDVSMADSSGSMVDVGTYNDQTLSMFDLKVGYWVYRASCRQAWLAGVAPTVEIHYTSTLEDHDDLQPPGNLVMADPLNRWSNLNLTVGLQVLMRTGSTFAAFAVLPLKDDEDPITGAKSNFDAEFGFQLNQYF